MEKLSKIEGWFWDKKDTFDEKYEELIKWVEINERIPICTTDNKDEIEKKLGCWCKTKRVDKKNNKLSEERVKKLEEIKFWFWSKNEKIIVKGKKKKQINNDLDLNNAILQ